MYEKFDFEFVKKEKEPIWDYTRLDKAKLYQKMFMYPSFQRCFNAKYNLTEALIEELAIKTWGETHRIMCMSGETGTGKSLASQMLAKMIAENTGVEFLLNNICFTFDEMIERCRNIIKNSTIIADESVLQTGLGMIRERFDIMNIENVTRKFGLNIIWVYPKANIEHATAHFELETIGVCKAERLTKLAIKQGNYYFGYAIIDVTEALNDDMWIEYNKIKDDFIENVLQRRVKRMNFESYAQNLLSIPAFEVIQKINEMKAYARSCDDIIPSNITEQELNQIINAIIKIKKDREYEQYARNSQFDEAISKSLKEQYSFMG